MQTITEKVLRAERRRLDGRDLDKNPLTAGPVIWGAAMVASVLFAGYSLMNTDWTQKRVIAEHGIDLQTTASIRPAALSENRLARTNQRAITEQETRLETISGVIKRLRADQSTSGARIAELDAEVRTLRKELNEQKDILTVLPVDEPTTKNTIAEELDSVPAPLPEPVITRAEKEERPELEVSGQTKQQEVLIPPPLTQVLTNQAEVEKNVVPDVDETLARQHNITSLPSPETKSVDETVVGSITQAVPRLTTSFALDLGVNPSPQRAEDHWLSLSKAEPDLLGSLSPRYVPTNEEQGQTRLIVGPYSNAADAIRDCVVLKKSKAFCKTTLFPE